jgi:hypothetical protein
MGQGEDSRRPVGVPRGGGAVDSPRKKKTAPDFFLFYWVDKWALVHVSTNRIFFASSALIGGSHLLDAVSIRVQLAISVNLQKITQKVVVFCDRIVKSWFFEISSSMSWFYANVR